MSANVADLAHKTLLHLTELGLPPTPANYVRYFYELTGESSGVLGGLSQLEKGEDCVGIILALKGLLDTMVQRTSDLNEDLGSRNGELKKSVNDLTTAKEKHDILRLLQEVVGKAESIHSSVDEATRDLVSTKRTLERMRGELKEARKALNEDALTGAQNRRAMDAVLNKEVARAMRYQRPLAVIMIDIDHFKRVNDTYGHDAGDKLLLHFTMLARSILREADVFIRYGGEEFLVLLPDSEIAGAVHVADRLRELMHETPLQTDQGRIEASFSAGVAQYKEGENGHSLVLRADKAMYDAKQAGRGCTKIVQ